jgi:hypothetical protein
MTNDTVRKFEQTGWCRNQPAVATSGDLATGTLHVTLMADAQEADVADREFIAHGEYTSAWLQFLADQWRQRGTAPTSTRF